QGWLTDPGASQLRPTEEPLRSADPQGGDEETPWLTACVCPKALLATDGVDLFGKGRTGLAGPVAGATGDRRGGPAHHQSRAWALQGGHYCCVHRQMNASGEPTFVPRLLRF